MPTAAGHNSKLFYYYEQNSSGDPVLNPDGGTSDSNAKPFGTDATLDTRQGSHNAVRVFDPNSREAKELIEQQFEGSATVSFELTNAFWLKAVISDATVNTDTPTSGANTFVFDGSIPFPLTIKEIVDDIGTSSGNDQDTSLYGFVVSTATISVDVNGNVSVTLEGAYADEETDVDASGVNAQPQTNERTLTFAHAKLQRPDGDDLSLTQSVEVTISNNPDMIGEIGTRKYVDYSPKVREADVDYTRIVANTDDVSRLYGDGATSVQESMEDVEESITFEADNGKTGSERNGLTLSLTGNFPDTYNRDGVGDPEADLEDNISEVSVGVTAEYISSETALP